MKWDPIRLRKIRVISLCLLCAACFSIRSIAAEIQTAPLTSLVGRDVGVCLHLTELRQNLPKIRSAELFKRVERMALYRRWLESNDFGKLRQAGLAIEKAVNKPIGELALELFGESLVFAVYPLEKSKPSTVLLTRTAGAAQLASAVAVWNQGQHLDLEERHYGGRPYFRRTQSTPPGRPQETQFYLVLERDFAVSDSEAMIRRVIDLAAEAGRDQRTALPFSQHYVSSMESLSDADVVRVYFNPRAWDDAVLQRVEEASVFKSAWRRFQSLAVGIDLQTGFVVEADVRYDSSDATELWTQSVRRTDGPPEFLKRVSADAFVTFAGRYDPHALGLLLVKAAAERESAQLQSFRQVSQGLLLGLDVFDDVLPELRPNCGAYIVARQKLLPGVVPFDGLLALELPPARSDAASPRRTAVTLRAALDNGLNTALNLFAAYYNAKATEPIAVVRTQRQQDVTIRSIDSIGAYQPAYAITADYLVLASSPRLITDFVDHSNVVTSPVVDRVLDAQILEDTNQVLLVNVKSFREFIAANRQFLIAQAKGQNQQAVQRQFERLDDIARLIDTGVVALHIGEDRVRLTLGGLVDGLPAQPGGPPIEN